MGGRRSKCCANRSALKEDLAAAMPPARSAPQKTHGSARRWGESVDPARSKDRPLPRRPCILGYLVVLLQHTLPRDYPLSCAWPTSQQRMKSARRDYPRLTAVKRTKFATAGTRRRPRLRPLVQRLLSGYGGAPTPATECVPHGVLSTMRAGALCSPTDSVAARPCLSVSFGREPETVPCQW